MPSRRFSSPAAPVNLADHVADTIRRQLIDGELRAGQRLSEAVLSEQLQISRNTLREVFRSLIKEGLLLHEPNRGVSVVVPSIADIIDIYRVRRLIECQALERPGRCTGAQAAEAGGGRCGQRARGGRLAKGGLGQHGIPCGHRGAQRQRAPVRHVLRHRRRAAPGVWPAGRPGIPARPSVDHNARLLQLFMDGQTSAAARELEAYLVQSERMVLAVYAQELRQAG